MKVTTAPTATLEAVRDAATLIAPHVRRTPTLPTDLDSRLLLKAECFQRTGSFKLRGAFNAILRLDPARTPAVITASSGNHAQAVALAAKTAGIKATILIPEGANPLKVAATKSYGAEVISEGITFENRDDKLVEYTEKLGAHLVHPYDDWDVIHGQGTGALEFLEDAGDVAAVAAPIGGGGQISGWAIVIKALSPKTKVIGVEPAVADDAARSLQTHRLERLADPPDTLADGVKTLSIGQKNYEVIVEKGLVDEIVTVTEDELAEATRTAWLRCKLALEPTGALPLAAFMAGKLPAQGRLGLLLSGGNFDPKVITRLLAG
jgi:threonine dehydratase